MSVLTKKELVGIYAEKNGVTKTEAEKQLNSTFEFFDSVLTEYQTGFKFGNVGTFEVVTVPERAPRKFTNMHTGEEGLTEAVPAHTGFKFKPNKGKTGVREQLKNS